MKPKWFLVSLFALLFVQEFVADAATAAVDNTDVDVVEGFLVRILAEAKKGTTIKQSNQSNNNNSRE